MKIEDLNKGSGLVRRISHIDEKIKIVESLTVPPILISDGRGGATQLTSDEIDESVQRQIVSEVLNALFETKRRLSEELRKL